MSDEQLTQEHVFSFDDRPLGIEDAEVARVGDGFAVFCPSRHQLHRLGELAASVWLLCDGETTVHEIVDEIARLGSASSSELSGLVLEALDQLAVAGLVERLEVPFLVAVERDEIHSPDGSKVLLAPPDRCGVDADTSVWADSIVLRIGAQRDHLLRVRVDCDATGDLVRTLFAAWIDAEQPAEVLDQPAMFSIWMRSLDGQRREKSGHEAGLLTMPHVRLGSTFVFRHRDPHDVLRALTLAVGGAHERASNPSATWVTLRTFIRGDRAVLADIDRPEMVSDPTLARNDVHELPTNPIMFDHGDVVLPAPLPHLEWASVGIEPPEAHEQRYRLAGVMSMRAVDREPEEMLAKMMRHSFEASWFHQVAELANSGELQHVTTHGTARSSIVTLL